MPQPAAPSPVLPPRVRCYSCGRWQDPSADACQRCATTFAGMCPCGTLHSLYLSTCTGCGGTITPRRFSRSRLPVVRAARWGIFLVAVVGAAIALARERAEKPGYAWKAEGVEQYLAGRYEAAAKSFEAATQARPRDAESWYSLATCYRQLKMSPDTYLPSARRAAELDPNLLGAQIFLSVCEREAGNLDRALEHARRAAALPAGDGTAERIIAELELSRPGGDVQAALAALRRAVVRDPGNVQAKILTAECYLRLYGTLPTESYPPEAVTAIEEARVAMTDPSSWADAGVGAMALAHLQLCVGASADAYATATDGIDRGGAAIPDRVRARLLVIRARALLAWRRDREAARADLIQALETEPTLEMASAISLPLTATGEAGLAEDALTTVAARHDPSGGVSAARVSLLLRRGAVGPALAAARRAADLRPDDLTCSLILGDALRANRDPSAARIAYAQARALPDGVAEARIALLALDEMAATAGNASLISALASLEPFLAAPRPGVSVQMAAARLRIALREATEAVALATRATESAPGLPETWLLLAEAHSASRALDGPTRAAFALQRARRLLPDDEDVCVAEAEAHIAAMDTVGAVVASTCYLDRHPDATRMLKLRGRARSLGNRWADAACDLRRVVVLDPTDADAAICCAESELRDGDRAAALRTLERVDVTGHRSLADMVSLLRLRIDGATIDQAADRLRENGASGLLARVFLLVGRVKDAAAEARRVLAESKGDPGSVDVLVHAVLDANPESEEACAEATRAVASLSASAPRALAATLRARILIAEHRWEDAWAEIAPFREELGRDAVARFVLGSAALRSGRTQEGLDEIRRSVEILGGPDSLRVAAADAFAGAAASKDTAFNERCSRFALTLSPDHPAAAARLSQILADRGDFVASAAVAEQGLRSPRATKQQAFALRLLAASAESLVGSASLARSNLEQAAKLEPGSSAVMLLRGSVCLADGDMPGATAAFEEVQRANPSDAVAEAGLIAVELRGDSVDLAVRRAKRWQAAHPQDVTLDVMAADQLSRIGRFDAAADVLRATCAQHPGDLSLAQSLVSALVACDRHADAVAVASELMATRPKDDAEAVLFAARVAAMQTDSASRAVDLVRRARAVSALTTAQTAAAWAIEADALLRLSSMKDAEAAARTGMQFVASETDLPDRSEPILRFVLGVSAYSVGDLAAALREFERCVELAPGNTDYLNDLACVLAKTPGNGAAALRFAIRAVKLRPRLASLWDTRAIAADAAGDAGDADRSRRTCLTLHAAAPFRDPDGRARTAIALAGSLAARGLFDDARQIAADVATWTPAPSAALLKEAASLASK
ncbi:MAG: tetratricopeptide repeat protein [Planctomycetes bacterium]|nr:tetratricopeptide repeat protein [Planctomycetota bacterium]